MAADTARKRYSAMNIGCPWRGLGLLPNPSVDLSARRSLLFLYGAELTEVLFFSFFNHMHVNILYGGEDGF